MRCVVEAKRTDVNQKQIKKRSEALEQTLVTGGTVKKASLTVSATSSCFKTQIISAVIGASGRFYQEPLKLGSGR